MEQWMIFFRKIHYLSFIRTLTVCSFCILFVSSSFCSLGGHTFGRILLAQKSSVFCNHTTEHSTLGLHSTHTTTAPPQQQQ
jgi:hypothetical protein